MGFEFGDVAKLEDSMNKFEVLLQAYNNSNEVEVLPDAVVKNLLLERLPEPFRGQLELNVSASTPLDKVQRMVREFLRKHREFQQSFVVPGEPVAPTAVPTPAKLNGSAMDVDFLGRPWKGKGKGKGKAKGKKGKGTTPSAAVAFPPVWWEQQNSSNWMEVDSPQGPECYQCGGWGHTARYCGNSYYAANVLGKGTSSVCEIQWAKGEQEPKAELGVLAGLPPAPPPPTEEMGKKPKAMGSEKKKTSKGEVCENDFFQTPEQDEEISPWIF